MGTREMNDMEDDGSMWEFIGFLGDRSMLSALVYMVRIPGFHPGGPGSIPGCGTFLYLIT